MRPKVEWLILPLFALPLLLAFGIHVWASAEHERDLDSYRLHGREQLARMTGPAGAAAAYTVDWRGRPSFLMPPAHFVPVTYGTRRLRVAMAALGEDAWNFADAYPTGLSPSALADSDTRIQVETGTAPLSLPSVDAATRAFHRLLREPDLGALRTAMLPPTTKRYIAEVWLESRDETWMRAAVTLARAIEHLVPSLPAAPKPGYHVVAGFDIEVPADGPITFPLGYDVGMPPQHVAIDPLDDEISLWFSKNWAGRPRQQDQVLWMERLDAPLAGHWAFTYRGSMHWWQAARFRKWVPPGVAVLLLLLAIPAALQFALRKRRRLDEARARFINELAHDLRTPLTSLRLHAEMLGSGRTPDERRPQYVGLIEQEALRLTSLLANLLDLSRLEGTRATLHPESIGVAAAVEQAVSAFAAVHPERASDVSIAGEDDVTVRADAAALGRVLGNLLENAGKFTEPGTPVRVSWARERGKVQLTLADDGPGVPAEERRRIFERYARGASAKQDGVAGSGLGLALARELLTRMDGSIKLQPSPRGATFQIGLPEGDHA